MHAGVRSDGGTTGRRHGGADASMPALARLERIVQKHAGKHGPSVGDAASPAKPALRRTQSSASQGQGARQSGDAENPLFAPHPLARQRSLAHRALSRRSSLDARERGSVPGVAKPHNQRGVAGRGPTRRSLDAVLGAVSGAETPWSPGNAASAANAPGGDADRAGVPASGDLRSSSLGRHRRASCDLPRARRGSASSQPGRTVAVSPGGSEARGVQGGGAAGAEERGEGDGGSPRKVGVLRAMLARVAGIGRGKRNQKTGEELDALLGYHGTPILGCLLC